MTKPLPLRTHTESASAGIVAAVELPWPNRALSPNSRGHWANRASAAKLARMWARYACIEAGIGALDWEAAHVAITFHAPDRRPRDLDNMLASCKPLLDGIADATGIDDSRWSIQIERGEPVKGGKVVVRLSPAKSRSAA